MHNKRHRWLLAALPVVLIVLSGVLLLQFRPGIHVTIQNTGSTPMHNVMLHVTGVSYQLGVIPPGESVAARVRSKGESGLEVEFTDSDGRVQRLNAGGYFESGYRGTIHVSIKDDVIVNTKQDILLW